MHVRKPPGALLILGVFVILTLILTYPLSVQSVDAIANYGDPLLNAWILGWDAHQLITDPINLYNANIFYPYQATLAYSENLLGIAGLTAPIIWATDNPIFAHNLAVLVSFALSGLGVYLLALYLTGNRSASLLAGIAFAFAAFRLNGISQVQNMTVQWLPFAIFYLMRSLRDGATRDPWLCSLFLGLQALSCTYYAFYTTLAVLLYLIFWLWSDRGAKPLRHTIRVWARLILPLIVLATVIIIAFLPYFTARAVVGGRDISSQEGAALRDYVTLSPRSFLARFFPVLQPTSERGWLLFVGFIPLTFAIISILPNRDGQNRFVKKRQERIYFVLLGAVGLLFSLGPSLRLTTEGPVLLQPLPYAFLLKWVPGISAMRVPARMGMLVAFSVSILTAYGAARLAGRHLALLTVVATPFLVLELAVAPASNLPIAVGAHVPQVYHWLHEASCEGVILELPSIESEWFWEDQAGMERLGKYQYFSAYHWRPSIMGYSGFVPPFFSETLEYVQRFPSTPTLSFLRGLDVKCIILHKAEFTLTEWEDMQKRLMLFREDIQLIKQLGDDFVYRLGVRSTQAIAPLLSIFAPPTIVQGATYTVYAGITNRNHAMLVQAIPIEYSLDYHWNPADGESIDETIRGQTPFTSPEGVSFVPIALPSLTEDKGTLDLELCVLGQTAKVIKTINPVAPPDAVGVLPPDSNQRLFAPDLNFGNRIKLYFVALSKEGYRAGDSLAVTLYLQNLTGEPVDDLVFFFNLLDGVSGQSVVSRDMAPPEPKRWDASGRAIYQRLQQLPLDLAPGKYVASIGLYNYRKGEFVPVIQKDGAPQWKTFQAEVIIQ